MFIKAYSAYLSLRFSGLNWKYFPLFVKIHFLQGVTKISIAETQAQMRRVAKKINQTTCMYVWINGTQLYRTVEYATVCRFKRNLFIISSDICKICIEYNATCSREFLTRTYNATCSREFLTRTYNNTGECDCYCCDDEKECGNVRYGVTCNRLGDKKCRYVHPYRVCDGTYVK